MDGVDRAALFTKSAAEASLTLPANLALRRRHPHAERADQGQGRELVDGDRDLPVDATPPAVTIATPHPGDTTKETAITVSGGVTDSSAATVKVNGVDAAVTGPSFSAAGVPVGAGPDATFTAVATDAAGNTGSASVTVHVDRTPPTVQITSPADGAATARARRRSARHVR